MGEPMLISLNELLLNLAKPKSAIFAIPLWMNMFETLRSLCIMQLSAR